jgi:S-adenosylmethionine:tRNA ribosyltransferase-isomerase
MRVALFDYDLPPESIAQHPAEDRLSSRLLCLPPSGDPTHLHIRDLPDRLREGSLVVVNDTRVLPARLLGTKRASGGKAEVFLVRRASEATGAVERWRALGKASKGMRPGTIVDCGEIEARVVGQQGEMLEVELSVRGGSVTEALRRTGHVPLPPYIRRPDAAADRDRYQTMFARVDGAVAAPTAGLHLTPELVERLSARGCTVVPVTLHVGLGTFQPVTADDLDDHPMHAELFDIPATTAEAIADARSRGADVVGIGTTVVRALEASADPERPGHVVAQSTETRLLIQPGYRFQVVDRLLTNFHLPKSTLLALVAAFGGTARVLAAYAEARDGGYRFYSYGDAMLLDPCQAPPPPS